MFDEFGYPGDEKYPMFYFKTEWTMQGQVNKITPNFCTNVELVDYELKDWTTEGECQIDQMTGLPNNNCFPVLGQGNAIRSSIMAIPYLIGNDQFCDDTENLYHQDDIPTKHNDLCKGKSTFTVIKEHEDFNGYLNNTTIEGRETKFEILRARSGSNFVMVLDVSGSMMLEFPRLTRLIQSSKRWLEYDLEDGVSLGITKFSTTASIVADMTMVNTGSRPTLAGLLDGLVAGGGTCLGAGLKKGLEVLKTGGVEKGGIMIFLTDGEFACDGTDNTTIAEAIPLITAQEVRVITIAFSNKADNDIINLAKETDGKAFFVPDNSGPEVINTAMQGSLTYQPSVPSNKVDIIVFEETKKNTHSILAEFIIDETIGKNVSIQIDFSDNPGVDITFNDTTDQFDTETGVFELSFDELSQGVYNISITSRNTNNIGYASLRITAKARSNTVPIMTNCWTSVGNNIADMASNTKIAVNARVLQGTNPVIGAKVTAYIEREDSDIPLEISLLDTGSNPDNVANDGVYARYFANFDQTTADNKRYSLKCQVEGTDDSQINQGFIVTRQGETTRSLPSQPSEGNPICCGSNTVRDDSILTPTGNFRRSSAGGSIEVKNGNQANYPPGEVSNLKASQGKDNVYQILQFTSAGARLEFGTADEFRIYYSKNKTDVLQTDTIMDSLDYLTASQVLNPNALRTVEGGTDVVIILLDDVLEPQQQYFFRLVTLVRNGNMEAWSNIASIYNYQEQPSLPEEDGLKPGAIVGMVLGSIFTVFVVAGAIFLYIRRDN